MTKAPARRPFLRIAHLRGAVRLAVEGVQAVTHIAEGLHGNITRLAPPVGRVPERPTGGITGFVYRTVRGGTALVGRQLDAALGAAQAWLPDDAGPDAQAPQRAALLAALNGVLGDHLARTGNPLAIPMTLAVRGPARPRLLVLVHGLCMGEAQWQRAGHDHGRALARRLDGTPIYVEYNSGRHVSENGAELATRLEELVAEWPTPVESIAIVGHSMGGLVARSAVHQAVQAGLRWPGQLRQLVFLGTPHHGAALERIGNWLHDVLGVSPYLAPFARLGRLRSDGITDLRHGNVLEADWRAGEYLHRDTRVMVPLPAGVACYAIAGALGRAERVLGDGLVSVDSALGRHVRPTHDLHFAPSHTWVARGVHHLDLLGSPAVEHKLRQWLAPRRSKAASVAQRTQQAN